MTQPQTVTVKILDKDYPIHCPPQQRANLESAARYLDGKMREIRNSGKVIGADRIAVLAALNITSCCSTRAAAARPPATPANRCASCWKGSIGPCRRRRSNGRDDKRGVCGKLTHSSLMCWPVGDVPEPIHTTRGLRLEAGAHVRSTESLNASCNLHLELSGSRAKPTAAPWGVILPPASAPTLSARAISRQHQTELRRPQ
jgi:cell division protein ZapA (FtsZ GTPase activity inhibitor)